MDVRCDTAGEAGACGDCDHGVDHEIIPFRCHTKPGKWFSCPSTNTVVHCNPVVPTCSACGAEKEHQQHGFTTCGDPACSCQPRSLVTHTCYYCNHEGTDVNRIHAVLWGSGIVQYCCDDSDACDEGWQGEGESESLEEAVRGIVVDAVTPHCSYECADTGDCVDCATARIMKLLELPF